MKQPWIIQRNKTELSYSNSLQRNPNSSIGKHSGSLTMLTNEQKRRIWFTNPYHNVRRKSSNNEATKAFRQMLIRKLVRRLKSILRENEILLTSMPRKEALGSTYWPKYME